MGLLGIVYIAGRIIGKLSGSYLGAVLTGAEEKVRKYLGLAILSQAGVAVGLAILAGRTFGEMGPQGQQLAKLAVNTIAATTIIFEIIGPITTKIAITKSGEAGKRIRR
jgi:Kef-type K+ transport system membrane component KefB